MRQYIIDGAKAISLEQYPAEAWTPLSPGGSVDQSNRRQTEAAHNLYQTVSWLYRCVEIRANTLSRVPFAVMRGDTEIWHSRESMPPKQLAYMARIRRLLWLTEAALCLAPEAFWFNERNRVRTTGLRWLAPTSVLPVWDDVDGLIGFDRRLGNGMTRRFDTEDIVYIPRPNPMHETEPGRPPAQAGMSAAGVIYSVDAFSTAFFDRGAIKATLLTIDGNPAESELKRLEAWWKRFFTGMKSAWEAAAVRMGVTPVIVGEGIQELGNTELTKEKREDISTGMGIPHSLVMSNASNYATAAQDTMNFYDMTIVPELAIIAEALNEQIFEPQGLMFQPRADEMTVYQEDETQRGQAFKYYVDAKMKPSIAAQILGIDLPQGVEYADLDPDEPEPPQQQPPQFQVVDQQPAQLVDNQQPTDQQKAIEQEAARFRRWLAKRSSPDPARFESDLLTEEMKAAILEGETAATVEPFPAWDEYP